MRFKVYLNGGLSKQYTVVVTAVPSTAIIVVAHPTGGFAGNVALPNSSIPISTSMSNDPGVGVMVIGEMIYPPLIATSPVSQNAEEKALGLPNVNYSSITFNRIVIGCIDYIYSCWTL